MPLFTSMYHINLVDEREMDYIHYTHILFQIDILQTKSGTFCIYNELNDEARQMSPWCDQFTLNQHEEMGSVWREECSSQWKFLNRVSVWQQDQAIQTSRVGMRNDSGQGWVSAIRHRLPNCEVLTGASSTWRQSWGGRHLIFLRRKCSKSQSW